MSWLVPKDIELSAPDMLAWETLGTLPAAGMHPGVMPGVLPDNKPGFPPSMPAAAGVWSFPTVAPVAATSVIPLEGTTSFMSNEQHYGISAVPAMEALPCSPVDFITSVGGLPSQQTGTGPSIPETADVTAAEAAADLAVTRAIDAAIAAADHQDRDPQRDQGRDRDWDRDYHRGRERDRDRRERDRDRDFDRDSDRDRNRDRDRDRDRGDERDRRERDRNRDRAREHHCDSEMDRPDRYRDRDRDDGDKSRDWDRRRGSNSLADELRADRGDDPRDYRRDRNAAGRSDGGELKRRRKSKWDAGDDLAEQVPEWLRDQFEQPRAPPEPKVGPGQRSVKIPQSCVGKILGKMGATVHEIEDLSKCHIKINQDTKEAGYSFAIVTNNGSDDSALDEAERLINEKIAESGLALKGGPKAAGLAILNLSGGKEVKELKVDDMYVGGLIGRGGEHIKSMTAEVACKIQIDQKGGGEKATVIIGPGSPEQIAKAEKMVNDKCADILRQRSTTNIGITGGVLPVAFSSTQPRAPHILDLPRPPPMPRLAQAPQLPSVLGGTISMSSTAPFNAVSTFTGPANGCNVTWPGKGGKGGHAMVVPVIPGLTGKACPPAIPGQKGANLGSFAKGGPMVSGLGFPADKGGVGAKGVVVTPPTWGLDGKGQQSVTGTAAGSLGMSGPAVVIGKGLVGKGAGRPLNGKAAVIQFAQGHNVAGGMQMKGMGLGGSMSVMDVDGQGFPKLGGW